MSAQKKQLFTIKTSDILEAYEAHKEDFVIIAFDSMRKFKEYAQYFRVDIKKADGSIVPVRDWKLSQSGITVASGIKNPEMRKYEAVRLGVSLKDADGNENDNMIAMRLLCSSFEFQLKKMIDEKVITDDKKVAMRKNADGKSPLLLISTKVETPMQSMAEDKTTGEFKDMSDNPYFWLSVPKKKFYKTGEPAHETKHFNDKFYLGDNGQPDQTKPIMSYVFQSAFYNVEKYHMDKSKSDKPVFERLGNVDPETNQVYLDNTNIQNFLNRGSELIGNLKFEMVVNGRQCKLDISLGSPIYVKVAEKTEYQAGSTTDEDILAFSKKRGAKKQEDDNEDGYCDPFEE